MGDRIGERRERAQLVAQLPVGQGDVDFDAFWAALDRVGCSGRDDTVAVSSVFAEDENADEVSRFQLDRIREGLAR